MISSVLIKGSANRLSFLTTQLKYRTYSLIDKADSNPAKCGVVRVLRNNVGKSRNH